MYNWDLDLLGPLLELDSLALEVLATKQQKQNKTK